MVQLADCKPRLIYGFYEYLREDGDSEQTVLHYHNLLHTAFEYAITRPHGGHPIPESTPTKSITENSNATFNAIFEAENGRKPTDIITKEAITRPTVRNFLASERSESVPMINLLKA